LRPVLTNLGSGTAVVVFKVTAATTTSASSAASSLAARALVTTLVTTVIAVRVFEPARCIAHRLVPVFDVHDVRNLFRTVLRLVGVNRLRLVRVNRFGRIGDLARGRRFDRNHDVFTARFLAEIDGLHRTFQVMSHIVEHFRFARRLGLSVTTIRTVSAASASTRAGRPISTVTDFFLRKRSRHPQLGNDDLPFPCIEQLKAYFVQSHRRVLTNDDPLTDLTLQLNQNRPLLVQQILAHRR
jgi:hypothetical protein